QSFGLAAQHPAEVLDEVIDRRISALGKILVPVTNRDQERAGNREFRNAIRMGDQESGVLCPDGAGCADPPDDDISHFRLPGMLKRTDSFEAADPREEFANVVAAPPFPVTDDVESG